MGVTESTRQEDLLCAPELETRLAFITFKDTLLLTPDWLRTGVVSLELASTAASGDPELCRRGEEFVEAHADRCVAFGLSES